jgi:hypothetical protein
MLYSPRDTKELEAIWALAAISHAFASGTLTTSTVESSTTAADPGSHRPSRRSSLGVKVPAGEGKPVNTDRLIRPTGTSSSADVVTRPVHVTRVAHPERD